MQAYHCKLTGRALYCFDKGHFQSASSCKAMSRQYSKIVQVEEQAHHSKMCQACTSNYMVGKLVAKFAYVRTNTTQQVSGWGAAEWLYSASSRSSSNSRFKSYSGMSTNRAAMLHLEAAGAFA